MANKPGHRGEREGNRKTIARGMPGDPGVTVVSNSCAFYFCTRGRGRFGRPAFPAPSYLRGEGSCTARAQWAAGSRTHILLGCLSVVEITTPRHSGARLFGASFDVQLHIRESLLSIVVMDSGLSPVGCPGMTGGEMPRARFVIARSESDPFFLGAAQWIASLTLAKTIVGCLKYESGSAQAVTPRPPSPLAPKAVRASTANGNPSSSRRSARGCRPRRR
jgi:hypothetical protein